MNEMSPNELLTLAAIVIGLGIIFTGLIVWAAWPKYCKTCKGFGELPPNGHEGYTDCPICKGTGRR